MRSFLLLFLSAWLGGIAAGVAGVSFIQLGVIAVIATLFLFKIGWKAPYSGAAVILIAIGYLYALEPATITASLRCTIASPATGIIAQRPQVRSSSVNYDVEITPDCRALVTGSRFPVLAEGSQIALTGGQIKTHEQIEETSAGFAEYLMREGFIATWQYPQITRMSPVPSQPTWYDKLHVKISQAFVEPDAGIVQALLLADTNLLPVELTNNFRATGLSHLLAISGMNISLLAAAILTLLSLLPLSPLTRTLLTSSSLWCYMAFINWPVSAVRATFFWTIALLALRVHLLVGLPTVVVLTLLGMVSFEPALLMDIGFQLSVSAVVGIFLGLFTYRRYLQPLSLGFKTLLGSLLVTMGATATTWPIILYHFGTFSWISLIANLLIAPVVGLQMIAAIITLFLATVLPSLALISSYVVHVTVLWMQYVASALASIPGVYREGLTISIPMLVFYYAVLIGSISLALKLQGRSWREIWQ